MEYRFVNKEYFCHLCNKSFKKMININEPAEEYLCIYCNKPFIEEKESSEIEESHPPLGEERKREEEAPFFPTTVPGERERRSEEVEMEIDGDRTHRIPSNPLRNGSSFSYNEQIIINRTPNGHTQTIRITRAPSLRQSTSSSQRQTQPPINPQHNPFQSSRTFFSNFFNPFGQDQMNAPSSMFSPVNIFNFGIGGSSRDHFADLLERSLRENTSQNNPASEQELNSLNKFEITQEHSQKTHDGNIEPLKCPICCENLEVKTKAVEMPCKHLYHEDCLLTWHKQQKTCPVCRVQLN